MSCRHLASLPEQGELRGLFITPQRHSSPTESRGGASAQYYKSKQIYLTLSPALTSLCLLIAKITLH